MILKCPNCQKNYENGAKCPHCDVDTVLYMGTVRLSDKLFNKGLERLKAGDFFYGIEALTKSISINKNNVPSRNLLGLALFEVGHVGEALKHWVISQSMLKEENPATKYIESANKNARKLEGLNDAVEMYNQSLGHIKQKSDDLAIIQLKKALEINPRFVDALNLLTLCYLIQNEREKASATAERVLAIDTINPISLNYYSILNPTKPKQIKSPISSKTAKKPQTSGLYMPRGIEEKKQRNFHLAELLTFLIGVIVTVAAGFFLVIPAITDSHDSDIALSEQNLEAAVSAHQSAVYDLESQISDLSLEISSLNSDMENLHFELNEQRRINHVNQAYGFFHDGELRRAVDMLDSFERSGLPPDIISRMDFILEEAYPTLGEQYYATGLAYFNANNMYGAIPNLQNAYRFMSEDVAQWNRLLFMIGRINYLHENIEASYDALAALRDRAPGLPNFTGTERTLINNMLVSINARR